MPRIRQTRTIGLLTNGERELRTPWKENSWFVRTRYQVNAQPTYIILDRDGNPLLPPRNYDLDVEEYIRFLQKGLKFTINNAICKAYKFFSTIPVVLWGWPMIILLLGTHIFLTIRLKFPQRKLFKGIALSVKSDGDSKGDVSQFGSGHSIGRYHRNRNIGVATAVSLGGPGLCYGAGLAGVFGIATKYSEGLLAVKYRVTTLDGTMLGGPMYALERGLAMKWLAILFCVFTIIKRLGNRVLCPVELATMLKETFNVSQYVSGCIMAVLVALVIFFRHQGNCQGMRFSGPFYGFFLCCGLYHYPYHERAFPGTGPDPDFQIGFFCQAYRGGMAGGVFMIAMRYGIARGIVFQ